MKCGYQLRDCPTDATRMFVRRDHNPVPLCEAHSQLAEYAIAGGAPGRLVPLAEWLASTQEPATAGLPVTTGGH